MNTAFIRTFALLFGAVIALICAVYVYLIFKKKQNSQPEETILPNEEFYN